MSHTIFVTTGYLFKIKPQSKMLFAGEWCLNYFQKKEIPESLFKINEYHWNNLNKRERDYNYLKSLFDQLINSLSKSLNKHHGLTESNRYWQIIIGPWLYHYLGVMYDRWEIINTINWGEERYVTYIKDCTFETPFDFTAFISLSQNDEWNNHLFYEIFLALSNNNICFKKFPEYEKDLSSDKNEKVSLEDQPKPWEVRAKKGLLLKAIAVIDKALSYITPNAPFVIYDSPFRPMGLLKLFYSLKLIPRLYLAEFEVFYTEQQKINENVRLNLNCNLLASNIFEKFLFKRIFNDIPIAYLEGFNLNIERSKHLKLSPKVILSGSSHWYNEFFKVWLAEKSKLGVKFVIAVHGGGVPAKFEVFSHEDSISDHFLSWTVPIHPKQIRTPASKLLFRKYKKNGRDLLVVGGEMPKYTHQIYSGYISVNTLISIEMIKSFYAGLSSTIKKDFIVRNYANAGWNTEAIFKTEFGESKVNRNGKLTDAYEKSKLIICTYPETTYSEAMLSGIPTILIYDDSVWKIHENFIPLMELLKKNNMVFNSGELAAVHINEIWNNPFNWWNSTDILQCRNEFSKFVADLSGGIDKWKSVLNNILNN